MAIAGVVFSYSYYNSKMNYTFTGPSQVFEIKQGEGFASVNGRLLRRKIISDARLFHYLAKKKKMVNKLKPGQFSIKPGMTMNDVMTLLTSTQSITIKVTFPEGRNIYQFGEILEKKGIIKKDEFVKYCKNPEIIKKLQINAPSLEGYLFPETYYFSPKSTIEQIVLTMHKQFKKVVSQLDFSSSFLQFDEVITLASIVEKETGAKFERTKIAGVFTNRLKKKMRLQSDPTTIYGMYERYDGNIRKKDLLTPSPYNTYTLSRLPIGPIAAPSLDAIKAVLLPETHSFLYFVSKNDGTHIFTKNYKDHQKAVINYQIKRKNRKGKSWRDLKQ